MKPSLGIIAPNFGRPKILSLFGASIQRLRRELDIYIPVCIISGAEDKPICDKYFLTHIIQENKPVTSKFNRGMAYMKSIGIDYVLVSGSDDLFSTDTIRRIMEEAEKGFDLIGLLDIYFYAGDGQYKGQLRHLTHKRILGVGKTISARVLDKVDWRPWQKEKNWAMDALLTQSIMPHVKSISALSDTFVCDCKTCDNINKSGFWMTKLKEKIDPVKLYEKLSNEELQILKTL
jgi:hypothetical protein